MECYNVEVNNGLQFSNMRVVNATGSVETVIRG